MKDFKDFLANFGASLYYFGKGSVTFLQDPKDTEDNMGIFVLIVFIVIVVAVVVSAVSAVISGVIAAEEDEEE